ncbi:MULTISPECIES: YceI family protein [Chryseobacterium]|jgi:polyisoprenoid-binding protein YceI|uniref:YceI family protein n=1 Tax=Chryseobacterium TaxID=59732 RepID=UPI0006456B0E|nr:MULTISPECIES: YceI family protein [Chryseobacterium]MDC8098572.1 YceI family protein [Chryseobacterium rhizosphaerae]MDR6547246.1 polyisoprenoid-binding protein YceI [Chryseobacterium rhizosphaerae]SMC51624.1 Polyisoprenoid-binding protein YceI [Chryseobacterium sp. YR221]
MKKVFLSFVFALLSVAGFAQGSWTIDPMHSSVNFTIKHMGISFVQGRFDKFSGTVTTKGANLENAAFDIAVEAETINTGVEMRDKHLKSDDFFGAGKYPSILLEGTSIVKDKNGPYTLKAKLTIKDVQKEIAIPVTFGGITKNKNGKEVMGLQGKFTINRLDYNIKYDPTGTGVAKDVDINVYLELVKQ